MTEPLVVLQKICFEWGKEARGAALATARTQAPKSALLPNIDSKKSIAALVQHLSFSDSDAFQKPYEKVYQYEQLISARPAELELFLLDNVLNIRPYSGNPFGNGQVIQLRTEEALKLEWNERFPLEDTWRYRHTIINVGSTQNPLKNSFFLGKTTYSEVRLSQMY